MRVVAARVGRVLLPSLRRVTWTRDGRGEASWSGFAHVAGPEEAVVVRDALAAIEGDTDEPVVPVVVDGGEAAFWAEVRVASVLGPSWVELSVSGRRIGNRPTITSALSQEPRANAHAITTVAAQHAVPAAVEGWSWLPAASGQQEARQTAPGPAGGDVLYRRVATGTGLSVARWWCPPEHYYAGSCHVVRRVAVDGAPGVDVPQVGRGTVEGPWRAGNGLVEARLTSAGRLAVRWWLPTGGWSPTVEFAVEQGGGFPFLAWRAVEVMYLSAAVVKIRAQGVRSQGRSTLWLTLRRGSRVVECSIDTDAVPGHAVRPATPTAVVDDGLGHVYTPTGGSGLGWFIAAPDAFGEDLGTGRVTPANSLAPVWSWGIGAWVSGEAGDTGSRAQTVRDYYAARTEQVTVG